MLSNPRKKFCWLAFDEMLAVCTYEDLALSLFSWRDVSCHLWPEVCSPSSTMGLVRLFRIKIYVCFTSNVSHPCHPHKILHLRPSPRGNSKPAKCLPAHDTGAQTRLQNKPGACPAPSHVSPRSRVKLCCWQTWPLVLFHTPLLWVVPEAVCAGHYIIWGASIHPPRVMPILWVTDSTWLLWGCDVIVFLSSLHFSILKTSLKLENKYTYCMWIL